jgi:membrane protein HdeD
MKGISNILYGILRSLLAIVLGIFLLVNPESSVLTLVRIMAAFMLIGGLFSLYFAWKNETGDKGLQRMLYVSSFVFLVFALLLLFFPKFFTGLTMFIAGLILLLSGILQLTHIFHFRKVNTSKLPWFIYLNPVIVIILAVVILVNPFDTAVTLTMFAGVFFLIYALTEIIQSVVEYRLL